MARKVKIKDKTLADKLLRTGYDEKISKKRRVTEAIRTSTLIKMKSEGKSNAEIAAAIGLKSESSVNAKFWIVLKEMINKDAPKLRKIELGRLYTVIAPLMRKVGEILEKSEKGEMTKADIVEYLPIVDRIIRCSERISKVGGLDQISPDVTNALSVVEQMNVFVTNVKQNLEKNKIDGVITNPLNLEEKAEDAEFKE